jgi:pimeloyl-ACP methyl ester carboxylesterase
MSFESEARSREPPEVDYRIEARAADTAALIGALDLAPVVIVGMSLGGLNVSLPRMSSVTVQAATPTYR